LGSELKQCRETLMEEHGAPSRAGTTVLELATTPSMNGTIGGEGRDKIEGSPSTAQDTKTAGELARQVALPNSNQKTKLCRSRPRVERENIQDDY
jgi:hypothetical protein